jgi:hypothetical protein
MADVVPANAGYMVAAYTATALIVLTYAVALYRRGRIR